MLRHGPPRPRRPHETESLRDAAPGVFAVGRTGQRPDRTLQGEDGVVQAPSVGRVPGRAAQDGDGEDPALGASAFMRVDRAAVSRQLSAVSPTWFWWELMAY